jgi:hypothetical protein
MKQQNQSQRVLAKALVLTSYMPIMVDTAYAPLLWADPRQEQEILNLAERARTIGKQITSLNFLELLALYGDIQTEWTYHYGRDFQVFFLSVQIDAPPSEKMLPPLAALKSSFVLAFDLRQQTAITLLKAIIASKSVLVHFSQVPSWVSHLPSLSTGRSFDEGHAQENVHLVRTAVPLGFTSESIQDPQTQLTHFSQAHL